MLITMKLMICIIAIVFLGVTLVSSNSFLLKSSDDKKPLVERKQIPTHLQDWLLRPWGAMFDQISTFPSFGSNMLMDIKETPEKFEMHVDLPGVNKENIKITVSPEQKEMRISAFREGTRHEEGHEYKILERFVGNMTRTLYLPDDADIDKLNAEYKEGVLLIDIPKIPESKKECTTKQIEIK